MFLLKLLYYQEQDKVKSSSCGSVRQQTRIYNIIHMNRSDQQKEMKDEEKARNRF